MTVQDQYQLYNYILSPLLGETLELGRKYRSPLPERRDSAPSFHVTEYNGTLTWRDWGKAGAFGTITKLVQFIHNVDHTGAEDIIDKCPDDLVPVRRRGRKRYNMVWGDLEQRDMDYWGQYHIPPDILKEYKVYGARYLINQTDNKLLYDYRKDTPAFAYIGHEKDRWQFYCPSPKFFLRKNSFLIGYEQLPIVGDVCLIMSGLKDGLAMKTATGWSFVCGAGEADYRGIGKVAKELKKRFEYVGICLDPDPPGRESEELLMTETGLPRFEFPYPDGKKDIADLSKEYGTERLGRAFKRVKI